MTCRDLGTCGIPSDNRHSRAITANVAICFHILGLVTWFDHTHNRWLGFQLCLLLVVHCSGALRCGGLSILSVSRPFWSRYWWVHNKHSCISLKNYESIAALILNYIASFSKLFLQCNLNPRPKWWLVVITPWENKRITKLQHWEGVLTFRVFSSTDQFLAKNTYSENHMDHPITGRYCVDFFITARVPPRQPHRYNNQKSTVHLSAQSKKNETKIGYRHCNDNGSGEEICQALNPKCFLVVHTKCIFYIYTGWNEIFIKLFPNYFISRCQEEYPHKTTRRHYLPKVTSQSTFMV